jgi:integrase
MAVPKLHPGVSRRNAPATAVEIAAWAKAGGRAMHGCGGNLWFRAEGDGKGTWFLRYRFTGNAHALSLGRYPAVTLAAARQKARAALALLDQGTDPASVRDTAPGAAPSAPTFAQVAQEYIAAHAPGWRNAKHRQQWANTLASYAYPVFGGLPVNAVTTDHVLAALRPIWTLKTETAGRLRGRIEIILDAARARGWRTGENPSRWRGHLALLLPPAAKVAKAGHHTALPWQRLPEFMPVLAARAGTSVLALRFVILTAARSGEVRGCTWGEIDWGRATWTVPAERMKSNREHRVPLPAAALAVLAEARAHAPNGDLVFPGVRAQPLSDMTLTALLRRLQWTDDKGDTVTAHGFRSTFRDWCAETTDYPTEVAEMALAHAVANRVEAAYRRGDLFEKRRRLMDDWAAFVTGTDSGVVVPLPARAVS